MRARNADNVMTKHCQTSLIEISRLHMKSDEDGQSKGIH